MVRAALRYVGIGSGLQEGGGSPACVLMISMRASWYVSVRVSRGPWGCVFASRGVLMLGRLSKGSYDVEFVNLVLDGLDFRYMQEIASTCG